MRCLTSADQPGLFARLSGWVGSGRALIAIGNGLVGVAVLAVGVTIWNHHGDALARADVETRNLAGVVAEVTSRTVQAVDVVLCGLQSQLTGMDFASPEEFRSVLGTREAGDLLRSPAEQVPQVAVINLLGADGQWVNSSRGGPAAQQDEPDRAVAAHFAAVRDTHLFISVPVISRSSGEWSVLLARGIYGPAGQYVATVLAALPLSVFSDFYASITLHTKASFLLVRRDGIVLVRYPDATARAGHRIPANSDWYRMVAQGGGSLTSPGYFDTIERLVTVQPLPDYPLVTAVGISKEAALAAWSEETRAMALGTLGAAICLLLLLRALQHRFAHLQRSQAALSARNAELMRAGAEHKAAADDLSSTLGALDQGLMMVDAAGVVAVCNRRAMDMLELPEELMASRPSFAAVAANWPAVDAVNAVRAPDGSAPAGSPRSGIRTWHTTSGEVLEIRRVELAGGGFVASFDDVTARRHAEAQVVSLARHDPLTGLPNRAALMERLEETVAQAGRGVTAALLCLDLDHFKKINDSLGHALGDLLLREVADRVGACLREVDAVSRLGGDEFAVVQHDPKRIEDVGLLAQRIIDVIRQPYDLDGQQAVTGASLGIAMVPADGANPGALLKNADIALYRAKADGRGVFRFFAPEMDVRLQERRRLELDLHRAAYRREFELFFQPVVNLSTARMCGVEALLRWHHPTRGLVTPREFIEICEETGQIVSLGQWVISEACRLAAGWPDDVRVAVNLSPLQFQSRELVRSVADALDLAALPGRRLELEITERVLLDDSERVLSILRELRALGLQIAMDDFGTGYSSVSTVRSFPFERIKIDRSFIRDLPDSEDATAIVRAITRMSEQFARHGNHRGGSGNHGPAVPPACRGLHGSAGLPVQRSAARMRD